MQGTIICFNPVVSSGCSGNVNGKQVVTPGVGPQHPFPRVV